MFAGFLYSKEKREQSDSMGAESQRAAGYGRGAVFRIFIEILDKYGY